MCNISAKIIQGAARGWLVRMEMEERRADVTIVQSLWRGKRIWRMEKNVRLEWCRRRYPNRGVHMQVSPAGKRKRVNDPFKNRRRYTLLDRERNKVHSSEFPEEFWEVRKQPQSGHCYLKHLSSGSEFTSFVEARKLAVTMEYYDATAIASTTSARQPAKKGGPFTKRRTTYPLLDRVKNTYHSKEFPEEGKEFLHKDDARKLAIEPNIYDPPAEEVVNPAAKYRGLPFLSRSQSNPHTFAISEEFPEDMWEVRRSQSCQYYFKHRKTGREFHRISDARTFTRRTGGLETGGLEGYGDIEEDIIKEEDL